jgi:hypothetical protein
MLIVQAIGASPGCSKTSFFCILFSISIEINLAIKKVLKYVFKNNQEACELAKALVGK